MKVLHLFSDWKWTGPAEPTVSLCEALYKIGVDVTISYRKAPPEFPERTVEKAAQSRGIPYYDQFKLNRYFSAKDWLYDIRSIKKFVRQNHIDIVHTNLSHDHFEAIFALAFSKRRPLIIRSDHKRDGLPRDAFMAWAFDKTDGLTTFSKRIMDGDLKKFRFPSERSCILPPGIHLYDGPVTEKRSEFHFGPDDKVIGVIGRLKPDRGYDVILKAFKRLRERMDRVKLIVVGRSSQIEKSIKEPLAELGIENDVILAGYRIEDYFSVIAAFDIFVMMRAGSDGTARALREVLGMGVPAIVSDLGMLPELVKDGVTGFSVPPDEKVLAEKMEILLANNEKRKTFGEAAAAYARSNWEYRAQAQTAKEFYEKILALGPRR